MHKDFLHVLVVIFFWLGGSTLSLAQIDSTLIPIPRQGPSPVGIGDYSWGCLANFTLSDPSNWGRIQFVKSSENDRLFIIDNNGFLYCIHAISFEEIWKQKLRSQYIADLLVSASGTHIVISYQYAKSFTKTLDIIDGNTGNLIRQIRRYPSCYDPSYLFDMIENTSLYPGKIVMSDDGLYLAIWFHNHGFNTLNCIADEIYELSIFNLQSGQLVGKSNELKQFIDGQSCDEQFHFTFDKKSTSIWLSDCNGKIVQIDIQSMQILSERSFAYDIQRLLDQQEVETTQKIRSFSSLSVQNDNTLVTSIHTKKAGIIFKIDPSLATFSHVTLNQDMDEGHILYSPDGNYVMMNANKMNIWDLSSRKPILYDDVPKAIDGNTVCFHPSKAAIIVGTDRTIKLLARCHRSTIKLEANTLTRTKHFIAPATTFSVRGKGRLNWAYDDVKIYKKYSRKDELSTDNLGKSKLFNKKQNLQMGTELLIQSTQGGVFDIFGGFSQSLSTSEAIQQLPDWRTK